MKTLAAANLQLTNRQYKLDAVIRQIENIFQEMQFPDVEGTPIYQLLSDNLEHVGDGVFRIVTNALAAEIEIAGDGASVYLRNQAGVLQVSTDHITWQAIGGSGATETLTDGTHSVTALQVQDHIADSTLHYAQTAIDHANLQNVGEHTHAEIDAFMAAPIVTLDAAGKLDVDVLPSSVMQLDEDGHVSVGVLPVEPWCLPVVTNCFAVPGETGKVKLFASFADGATRLFARWPTTLQVLTVNTVEIPTVLLIHSDATNGSTVFVDSSDLAHVITAYGDVCHALAAGSLGGTAIAFDGMGDFLGVPGGNYLDFGTGDFTLELRYFPRSLSPQHCLLAWQGGWTINTGTDGAQGTLGCWINSGGWGTGGFTASPIVNMWNHVAVVRHGVNVKVYLNGVASSNVYGIGSAAVGSAGSLSLLIGARDGSAGDGGLTPVELFSGYIEEVRISKGLARWTADFTPPSAMYSE
jgi:hypothetical protein